MRTTRPNAFSLVELLAVIAVAAVVLSLLLPSLAGAKLSAQQTASLAATRQLLAATELYTQQSAGFFPYLYTPTDPDTPPAEFSWMDPRWHSYFRTHARYWPTALVRAGLIERAQVMTPESIAALEKSAGPDVTTTLKFFTHAAAATPEFWRPGQPPNTFAVFRGQRRADVRYPSSKGLTLDVELFRAGFHPAVGWADGSASSRPIEDAGLARSFGAYDWKVTTTDNGVLGRDR